MRVFWAGVMVCLFASSAMAYHEFQEPKQAYRVETIQYYSNPGVKTEPDSTVTIYYDGEADTVWTANRKTHKWESRVHWSYWEIYRKVVKGCGNVIGSNWDRDLNWRLSGAIMDSSLVDTCWIFPSRRYLEVR